MKVDNDNTRYDLYIVSEHAENESLEDTGHLNASYATSESEERLKIEITDQAVIDDIKDERSDNNNQPQDKKINNETKVRL